MIDLIFPPTCLECKTPLEKQAPFCENCLAHFTLLPVEGRCQKCFSEIPLRVGTCKLCRTCPHPFRRLASCFDSIGPALSLHQAYRRGYFHFAKEMASYLVIQMEHLAYPPFDLITSLPRRSKILVAKTVAEMLQIPFYSPLKQHIFSEPAYSLKKSCNIINQNVLLLDDMTKQMDHFRAAGFALSSGWPQTIYGLTFCAF